MAIKKSQIYASLWQSCNELRGGMDTSQYKDYILTLFFMKYVSDQTDNNRSTGIIVPEGGGFVDMVAVKHDKEIGDKINKIIRKFAKENDLTDVFDEVDFNDENKLGNAKDRQERLSELVNIFEGLDLRANHIEGDDLLRNFVTESRKSEGQFYTPAEVSRIMTKVIGIGPDTRQDETVYDPACGSGSLLLQADDEAPRGLSIYGQEINKATFALASMNMILHDNADADIQLGNTLTAPAFTEDNGLKTFDFAVADPPFSNIAWTNGLNPENDVYNRFKYGVPPTHNSDYAFLLHFIASLKSKGKGAIVLPHGVLSRGNKEADIRKNLIERGFIKGIIGLPPNLLYDMSIPVCILVIDKENATHRTGIFMIDASKGVHKDGNKNRLRAQDIHKIVSVFNEQTELPRYSRMVPISEIANPMNDYRLNILNYIALREPEDLHDFDAHLNGGIPDKDIDSLDTYWVAFPTLRNALFKANGRPGYSDPLVETQQLKMTICSHIDFKLYQRRVNTIFRTWREAHEPRLLGIDADTVPKKIIETLSEDLFTHFSNLPLLDPYEVYQKLMDYWDKVMQDDVYLITADGWVAAAKPREVIQDGKVKEPPDLVIKKNRYKMDLIPPALIVASYFAEEQDTIEALQKEQTTAAQTLEEYIEEQISEDGVLADFLKSSGNTNNNVEILTSYSRMLHERQNNDKVDALKHYLSLLDGKSKADKAVKDAQLALDAKVLAHYATLTEVEIKTLVVENKWIAKVQSAVECEVQRLTQTLAERVQELEERYAQSLLVLEEEVERYRARVAEHLQNLGTE